MRGLIIGVLAVISSMTMAQDRKDHPQVKGQVGKLLSNTSLNQNPNNITIICIDIYYGSLKQIPDGKLKARPYISLPFKNIALLPPIPKNDSLKK